MTLFERLWNKGKIGTKVQAWPTLRCTFGSQGVSSVSKQLAARATPLDEPSVIQSAFRPASIRADMTLAQIEGPDANMAHRSEVALIVGTGPGLGSALARRFAKAGMIVAVAARNTEKLKGV